MTATMTVAYRDVTSHAIFLSIHRPLRYCGNHAATNNSAADPLAHPAVILNAINAAL